MGKKRRSFSKEFKLEAVKLVKEGGLAISAAAQDLGICETSLRRCGQERQTRFLANGEVM